MCKQPSSRYCFMCGKQNPIGLKMEWMNDKEEKLIKGIVVVPEHFNGYPGVVHGGIVAAILDETAGRSVLLSGDDDNLMVTLKLEVVYKLPTPTETELTAVGWATKMSKHRAFVEAELRLPDGTVTASCKAIVVRPPQEVMQNWEEERKYWKVY